MQTQIFYLQSQISNLQAQLSDITDEMKSIKGMNQAKQIERDLAKASSTLDSLGYEKRKQTGKDGEEYTVWQKKAVDSGLQSVADRFEGEVPTRPCAAGTPFNSRISEAFISTAKIKGNPMPDHERTSSPVPPPSHAFSLEGREIKMGGRVFFIKNGEIYLNAGEIEDKAIGTLNIKIDESLERRIKDIVKESLAEQPELTAPISMPVSVSDDGRGCVGGVSIGQAPLKAYEETQDAKLELISTLIALADTTDDHSTAIMLRLAVKRIFQRDFKIDFDSGAQEEKPHIPQPKSI